MPVYIQFALLAVFLYAAQNVVIDRTLKGVSEVVTLALVHWITIVVTWTIILTRGQTGIVLAFPSTPRGWGGLALCAILLTAADLCYFRSYASPGGNVLVIPMLAVALPVFATGINALLGGSLPTARHVAAWALVALAVYLVSTAPSPSV